MTALAIGLALVAGGWLAARLMETGRRAAGARIDAALPLGVWLALAAATGRPVVSGIAVGGAAFGVAVAARAKRATLGETLVFTDLALAWQVLRFPRLYVPFAPSWAGALGLALLGLVVAVLALEPRSLLAAERMACALFAAAILAVAAFAAARLPFARLPDDATRFGLFATLAGHGLIAWGERAGRRAALAAPLPLRPGSAEPPHVVLVQAESFCDPHRILPELGPEALPEFARLRATGAGGPFAVPGFGANTMRTEFGVLTGLDAEALGLDAFNPYAAFARAPVPSLATRLAASGWRSICVHPFAGRFFGRHRVMPALGFDAFEDVRAFAAAPRAGAFVSDAALSEHAAELIAKSERPLFLFLITIANHGPYAPRHDALGWRPPASLPQGERLAGWLAGLAETDAMLGHLADVLARCSRPGLLAAYGDHPPALPQAFAALGAPVDRTDWLLWPHDGSARGDLLDPLALHRRILAAIQR